MTKALAVLALAACESSASLPSTLPARVAPAPRRQAEATPDDLPAQPRLSAAAQRGIPAAGILIATRTDRQGGAPLPALERPDAFLLYRLTRSGLVELWREEATTVQALVWLDRRTLLAYRETDEHEGSLTRIVDGVAQAPLSIPLAAWGLPGPPEWYARLVVTARNELWLERCVKRTDPIDPGSKCAIPAALRVDAAPFARTGAAPPADPARRVDQPGSGGHLERARLPLVAAPAGHTIAMFSVPPAQRQKFMVTYDQGYRCTSPGGSAEHPGNIDWMERKNIPMYRPTSVRWVSTAPPAFVVVGTATDMIGRTRLDVSLFRACASNPARDAAYLGGDLWAELDDPIGPGPGRGDDPPYVHSTWQLRVADQHVATLVGSQAWFAPQPL